MVLPTVRPNLDPAHPPCLISHPNMFMSTHPHKQTGATMPLVWPLRPLLRARAAFLAPLLVLLLAGAAHAGLFNPFSSSSKPEEQHQPQSGAAEPAVAQTDEYDYIVVGAGGCGAVIASRLAGAWLGGWNWSERVGTIRCMYVCARVLTQSHASVNPKRQNNRARAAGAGAGDGRRRAPEPAHALGLLLPLGNINETTSDTCQRTTLHCFGP